MTDKPRFGVQRRPMDTETLKQLEQFVEKGGETPPPSTPVEPVLATPVTTEGTDSDAILRELMSTRKETMVQINCRIPNKLKEFYANAVNDLRVRNQTRLTESDLYRIALEEFAKKIGYKP